jgi:ech hydrogenase subunit D
MDGQALLERTAAYRAGGWRLALINATSVLPSEELGEGAFDISWSFAKDGELEHIRERVLPGEEVPSISPWFGGAFLFENELRELFGVAMTGIALDLHGQLYQTAERVPFAPSAIRARIERARPPAPPRPERQAPPDRPASVAAPAEPDKTTSPEPRP